MTLIILEGPDCCFKSTVAAKLSKELKYPIIKGSSFELAVSGNEKLFEHFNKLADEDNVIIDRFVYSNLVYARKFKDYSILSEQQLRIIEDKIKSKAKVVYLHADSNIIKQRLSVRGDEYIEAKDIYSILDLYREVMNNARLHTYSWDTGQWDSDEIVKDLIYLLEY
ncbi:deoxynucleoside kinase [Bacillus spizizenii]|uniref:deoxynucleoside kinase n=1 Tax=Bacillus subtilis group TaxID=653685 RepID=UPI00228136B0|nr:MULTISPECIES: deoxynucleoside kinase [Bacillus subtilis group]MCY8063927.1 deoxynucleoside kinase [Bacillus spizizenii]MCY8135397.1 deoxynucleoside kinase [Bacillus spizizenii]MCY8256973.1 deoxynucleoside kinase [Bacillus spizizenii]MCY8334602.1 deoxynucleoside kinase [Bacillus spizizenii]MCY9084351.1 deoxynucleoside kinase [Bacillus inaquosorum]